jgi:hypothetical protein
MGSPRISLDQDSGRFLTRFLDRSGGFDRSSRWFLVALAIPATLAGQAAAQYGGGWGGGRGRGWGMGGGYASTAQQAADYGMSSMMRAQGYQNLMNSEASKNWEQAKTLEIENRQKWTETYFEMRKTNREARAAEEGPRITQEQAIRLAHTAGPPRLGSTQLDPVTGHIEYPLVLQDNIFTPYRSELDRLFATRASSGGSIQFEDVRAIQQTVEKFVDVLREHVNDYPAGEYGRARTFLNSLANEARFPSG